jgi:hypothetical protein
MKPAILLAACAASALAQTPHFENAKLETRALQAPLGTELARISGPAWAGYSVPAPKGRGISGCWGDGATVRGPVYLEGSPVVAILFRVSQGKVEKVRPTSPECGIDAGGLPVYWYTGVAPRDSVAYLETLGEKGLVAIAMHADDSAVATLIRLAKSAPDGKTRGQALFWMAQRAGDKAAQGITEAIENDPDTEVKKKAVFALSQLPKDEGVPRLIQVAKTNRNPAVRKQAVFWLGQSNDARALQFLEEVLTR